MSEDQAEYDVVIVGGRLAGASLAARLGARGHRVLVLDRARFPSLPSVPSSAVVYASVPAALDELGLSEDEYGETMVACSGFAFEFDTYFDAVLPVPKMWGRDHAYGIDRERFDAMLWRYAGRVPSVERREQFAVSDVLRDGAGRVVGVVGSPNEGEQEEIRARCVVGADGRFSLIARKVGAAVVEEEATHLSTVYYAAWEGVGAMREGLEGMVQIFATGRGLDFACIPIPGDRMLVNTHERADRVELGGDPMGYYMGRLQRHPRYEQWLGDARRVSDLVGVKRIGNGYREPSGPGWVLVGDALHYKDPIDGQGIHDALLGAKLLDRALAPWLAGERGWDAAMAEYKREFWAHTHPMYVETVSRLKNELYAEPPVPVIKTLIRWMMTDPTYQERFLNYLGRTIPPKGWNPPSLMLGAAMRGLGRDLGGLRRRKRSAG